MNRLEAKTIDTFKEANLSYINETKDDIVGHPVSQEVIENSKDKPVIGKIAGYGANCNEKTRNDRKYILRLWRNVEADPLFQEGLENRTIIGELDHPEERIDYALKEGAVVLTDFKIENDGKVYTQFDILNTLPGRMVKTYFDAGCKLGVSSRGLGEEIIVDGETIIDPDTYQFYCFDVVAFPALKSARMELIESTSTKHIQLVNSIKKEIKNSKTLNEVLYIEQTAKDTNLYLDEIRESIEIKKEELDEEEKNKETKELAKNIISNIDKLGNKANEQDNELSNFLKAWLIELNKNDDELNENNQLNNYNYDENIDSRQYINKLIYLMNNKIDEYINMGDSITPEENNDKELLQKFISKIQDLNWSKVDYILNESNSIESLFVKLKEETNINDDNSTLNKEDNNKIKISDEVDTSDKDMSKVDNESDLKILVELNDEIANYKIQIDDLNNQISTKNEVIQNLICKVNDSEKDNSKKEGIIQNLLSNKNIINEDVEEVNDNKNQEDNVNKENQQNDVDKNDQKSQKELNDLKQQLDLLTKKYNNLQKSNNELSDLLLKVDESKGSTINKFKKLQKKHESLINQNKKLQEQINNELKSNKNVLSQNNTLKESLDSSNSNIKVLNSKISILTESENKLKERNGKLLERNKQLINDNKALKESYVKSLDKYIESICYQYDLNENLLRSLLGETYDVAKIDSVSNELIKKQEKLNALPFINLVPERQIVNENIGLIKNSDDVIEENLKFAEFYLNNN